MVTFGTKKKRFVVGEHVVIDQGTICAHVIDLLLGQRYLDLQQVLAIELTALSSGIFHADGRMWATTGKSRKSVNILQVEVLQRLALSPTAMVIDVSAVLWALRW